MIKMIMTKQFEIYFAKIISEIIEVGHECNHASKLR